MGRRAVRCILPNPKEKSLGFGKDAASIPHAAQSTKKIPKTNAHKVLEFGIMISMRQIYALFSSSFLAFAG